MCVGWVGGVCVCVCVRGRGIHQSLQLRFQEYSGLQEQLGPVAQTLSPDGLPLSSICFLLCRHCSQTCSLVVASSRFTPLA